MYHDITKKFTMRLPVLEFSMYFFLNLFILKYIVCNVEAHRKLTN